MAGKTKIRAKNLLGRPLYAGRQRALENAGFRTFGFGAGREDVWEPDLDVDWGNETEWLAHRHPESLNQQAIGATEMGLIYVNPEGPNASGDPLSAASAIRRDLRQYGNE
ncbi:catalase [Klebsiella michiganensis]|nr:catalase [Klebsiella michiganensis]